ncbi:hypothetical protein OG264_38035 [Streptomyces xanthophaeus]|uniref:hypothetical protein n=1 Tax=Streptomyces xanthophaeus TaxID=67385 RepID=UPI003868C256|nr:hypothetical protein OG264_38035 [Streptomyces xanthophaeus]WST58222.1 hypothetical protein OG605_00400 [Streptomyces xanthophaeus]
MTAAYVPSSGMVLSAGVFRPSGCCGGSVGADSAGHCRNRGQAMTKNFTNGERVRQVALNPSGKE